MGPTLRPKGYGVSYRGSEGLLSVRVLGPVLCTTNGASDGFSLLFCQGDIRELG